MFSKSRESTMKVALLIICLSKMGNWYEKLVIVEEEKKTVKLEEVEAVRRVKMVKKEMALIMSLVD